MSRMAFLVALGCLSVALCTWFICSQTVPRSAAASDEEKAVGESKPAAQTPLDAHVTQGALRGRQADGQVLECPLKHTDVKVTISGFIARAKVTQTFHNPFKDKIEAVYVFPLPHLAAVDDMTMVVGERRIVGLIKPREEARSIYEQALVRGQVAGLLEQERPNIFTQSVGNIAPGQEVRIEISYVDPLKYDQGVYEFHFPMVVGPRYIPGSPTGTPSAGGFAPNTDRVPDASRITPPPLKPHQRNGHDISLQVTLDAGVPVQDLKVVSHKAEVGQEGATWATVELSPADKIPNKDFVLRYAVAGEKPEMAVLAHAAKPGDGYFMLMIQPKLDEELSKAPPRELVFLIDVSGSMSGEPTAKVHEAMQRFLERSKPEDRIQVVTFASFAEQLFPRPVPATEENVQKALAFTQATAGQGGTEMLQGVKLALADPVDPERVRIVVMLTDGYIGNEAEIIDEVSRRCGDQIRFWTIGIGSSPNRFLLDGVARQGGGMSGVIGLEEDPTQLVASVVERIHRAQLAKIEIDWGKLGVIDTYPAKVPELWAGRPVILFGRYRTGGEGKIAINGTVEGKPLSYPLVVHLPDAQPAHDVLATMWARQKIEELSSQMYGGEVPALVEEITGVAMHYRLMSQYTSFVAVDEAEAKEMKDAPRRPRRVMVPVPLPEGVRWEGIFGPLGEDFDGDGILAREHLNGVIVTMDGVAQKAIPGLSTRRLGDGMGRGGLGGGGIGGGMFLLQGGGSRGGPQRMGGYFGGAGLTGFQGGGTNFGRAPSAVRGKLSRDLSLEFRERSFGLGTPQLGGFVPSSRQGQGGPAVADFAMFTEVLSEAEVMPQRDSWNQMALKVLAETAAARHQEAQQALKQAEELEKQKKWEDARARLQQAYLLEQAVRTTTPWDDDGTANAAAERLSQLEDQFVKHWEATVPPLARRLDLVIKNRSVEDAIAEVEKAGQVEIEVLPGSVEDAETLLGRPARVVYLDLRGASVAQALAWLLEPLHLNCTSDEASSRVTMGSSRRLPGDSPWVYSVGDLLLPTAEEIGDNRPLHNSERSVKDLLAAVRMVLGQKGESGLEPGSAVMIAADQLLVYGEPKVHGRVEALLAGLRGEHWDVRNIGGYRPSRAQQEQLESLRKLTAKRYAARAERRDKRAKALAQLRLCTMTRQNSWKLLAAASGGQSDAEAQAWLGTLWSAPEHPSMLAGPPALVGWHSLWAISESARAFPDDEELRKLAAHAFESAGSVVGGLARSLREKPDDANLTATSLYAVLALKNAQALGLGGGESVRDAQALEGLVRRSALAPWSRVARALLEQDAAVKAEDLAGAFERGKLAGDDLLVLHALASRRLDAAAWNAFRHALPDLAAAIQDDYALLTVNRLSASRLPLAAAR